MRKFLAMALGVLLGGVVAVTFAGPAQAAVVPMLMQYRCEIGAKHKAALDVHFAYDEGTGVFLINRAVFNTSPALKVNRVAYYTWTEAKNEYTLRFSMGGSKSSKDDVPAHVDKTYHVAFGAQKLTEGDSMFAVWDDIGNCVDTYPNL